jgi:hypothetical protein
MLHVTVYQAGVTCNKSQDPKSIKKPAFYAGLVEVLGSLRILSDDPNGPGTNQKSPEAIDTTTVSEIEAYQLPPELPPGAQIATRRLPKDHGRS